MAVRNEEDWLDATLQSIASQTYKNFELLVMDDGSTDRTPEILEKFAENDPRIKIFRQENKGNAESRNTLVRHAASSLIANMDGDDLAYPQRLEAQYEYMQKHPETVLLSTYARIVEIGGSEPPRMSTAFEEDELNRWYLSVIPPFIHSSVMYRKEAFFKAGGYRPDEYPAEDYGLWIRMKSLGKINTAPRLLTEYRFHRKGVSANNYRLQIERRDGLNLKNLEDLYAENEIPPVERALKLLERYDLNPRQRKILAKLACITGCFYVKKNAYNKAKPYFGLALKMDWRRVDALLNFLIGIFGKSFLISLDNYPLKRKIMLKIHWFGRNLKNVKTFDLL